MDFTPGVSRNADGRAKNQHVVGHSREPPASKPIELLTFKAAPLPETLPPYAATAGKFVANRRE